MTSHFDVSVVMSVYNGGGQLRETLDSLINQADVAAEIVVVNDGSTDDSDAILSEYAKKAAQLRIIRQENQGLTKALIRGCDAASGTYIARQDVGDVSVAHRLAMQRAALDAEPELSFVSCWTEFCGPEWEHLYIVRGDRPAPTPTRLTLVESTGLLSTGPSHHASVMFRKSAYQAAGGYREAFYLVQDWDLWFRLAEQGSFQLIEEPLYRARVFPSGLSSLYRPMQQDIYRLMVEGYQLRCRGESDRHILEQIRQIRPVKSSSRSSRTLSRGLYFVGECLRKNGDARACRYLREAVKNDPLMIRAWIRYLASLTMARSVEKPDPGV